jgi:hypothetical protein
MEVGRRREGVEISEAKVRGKSSGETQVSCLAGVRANSEPILADCQVHLAVSNYPNSQMIQLQTKERKQ